MTKKLDTPAADAHDSADEKAASGKRGFGFVWLLLAASAIGAGLWAVEQGYVDRLFPVEEAPSLAETVYEPPASPTSPMAMASSSMHAEVSALLAGQKAWERERAQLRRGMKHMESELSKLREEINKLSQSIEDKNEQPAALAVTALPQADAGETDKLREQVASLTARLDSLQQDYARRDDRYAAQLKLAQVMDAIDRKALAGEPFAQEMQRLRTLAMPLGLDTGAVDILQAHAQDGIMPLSALTRLFGETAQIALPYSLSGKEQPGIADNLRSNLAHVISIRKVDVETEDNSDEAHIARAEAELRAGNVEMAFTHLEQLSEQPRSLFYGWQAEAQGYLDVRDAIASLKAAATQQSMTE